MDEWIKKMGLHIHNGVLLAIEKNEIFSFQIHGWTLRALCQVK